VFFIWNFSHFETGKPFKNLLVDRGVSWFTGLARKQEIVFRVIAEIPQYKI